MIKIVHFYMVYIMPEILDSARTYKPELYLKFSLDYVSSSKSVKLI